MDEIREPRRNFPNDLEIYWTEQSESGRETENRREISKKKTTKKKIIFGREYGKKMDSL